MCVSVAYPSSQVSYRWHNPTLAVGYEGELQLSQFDIINTKYRQVNFSRDATGEVKGQLLDTYSVTLQELSQCCRSSSSCRDIRDTSSFR